MGRVEVSVHGRVGLVVIQRLLTLTVYTRVIEDVRIVQLLSRVFCVLSCDVRGLSLLERHRP